MVAKIFNQQIDVYINLKKIEVVNIDSFRFRFGWSKKTGR